MQFIEWFGELFKGEAWGWILPIAAGLLLLSALIAYGLQETGVYAAIAVAIVGFFGIAVPFVGLQKVAAWVSLSLLLVFAGGIYLLLFGVLSLRKAIFERKKSRAEIARAVQYTLPQRENGYIRERLNTSLHIADGQDCAKQAHARLGYARVLLGKVKAAPLSVAERLQTEEMSKTFALYRGKSLWTVEELRDLNDLCAALLKLSAKYSV